LKKADKKMGAEIPLFFSAHMCLALQPNFRHEIDSNMPSSYSIVSINAKLAQKSGAQLFQSSSDTLQAHIKMQCRFSNCCRYYNKDDHRCKDDQNVMTISSCAAAWQFDRYAKGDKDIGMNVANIFIIKIHNG
jgi:hypothetical protein